MQNRTLEQIVDVPLPPIMEVPVDVMRSTPQERVQNRILEQIVVMVPRILEADVDVVRATPQECVLNRTSEQLVDEPVPQIAEQAVRVTPQERVQNRILEQIVVMVPRILEADVDVVRSTPQECVVNRTPEQLVDEPVPQITEEIVEGPVPFFGAYSCTFSLCESSTSSTPLRRKRRTTKKMRRSRVFLLISVRVSGAVSCSPEALARMVYDALSHTMSLSSIQTHGSAIWWWVASC